MSDHPRGEPIGLRIVWMLLFLFVWQLAELLLAGVVLLQLIHRLVNGAAHGGLLSFGDSLSQYLAEIGRFGTFNTEAKPWPFADWPTPRAWQAEAAPGVAPAPEPVRDEEPKP